MTIDYFSGAFGASAGTVQGITQHDRLSALGPGRDHIDSTLRQLFDASQVAFRFDREPLVAGRPCRRGGPSFHPLIDRLAAGQQVQISRHALIDGTPMSVPDTELQLLAAVEYIEFGQSQRSEPIHQRRMTNHDRIKPTASPRTSCGRTEFPPSFLEPSSDLIGQL